MIRSVNLKKVFTTDEVETTALNNITMEIKEGEFVAVMGPSGCGKSTLLNILGLLDNPSEGEYYFGSQEVSKYSERQVEEVLERMNIMHRRNHFPQQLSGGQQQRVAISRAIVAKPKVILADEPTGNLDSANGEEVMKLLAELNEEGTTIIMVTHSPYDANYSHRIINVFDGKIVTENIKEQFHI